MRYLNKIIEYGILLFIFLIPWQARWIISIGQINGGNWEYGTQSLYVTEILLAGILALLLVSSWRDSPKRRGPIGSQNFLRWILSAAKKAASRMTTPAGILFLLLIWAGVSVFWAIDKNTALIHWRFLVEAGAVMLLIAKVETLRATSLQRKIQWAIILSAIVQVVFAVAQSNMQYIPASTELGMAAQNASNLGVSVVETVGGRWLRAYGSFPHPNILGAWLVLALIVLFTTANSKQQTGDRKEKFLSAISYLLLAILLFGLLLTFSRSAWLAFGVFLVVVILSHPTPRLRVVNWIRSRLVPRSFSEGGRIPAVIHETPRQARGDGLQDILLLLSFVIILFGLLLTFSRSAWLAFGVFLIVVILSHPTPRLRVVNWIRSRLVPRSFSEGGRISSVNHEIPRQARNDGFKLLALTILIITVFAAIFPDPFFSRFSSNRLEVKSQTERVASWQEGMEIIKKHPLLGVGMGNYGLAVRDEIIPGQPAWYYQPSHNVFLLIWSELGLIGILIIVILLYCYIVSSLRVRLGFKTQPNPCMFLLPLLVLSLFDHYLWSLYPGMMIGAVYLANISKK